jgi:hypothetical protein
LRAKTGRDCAAPAAGSQRKQSKIWSRKESRTLPYAFHGAQRSKAEVGGKGEGRL